MKHKKSLISIVLTLSLVLSLVPVLSTAAEAAAARSLTLSVMGKDGKSSSWEETWYFADGTLKNGYLDCYFSENPDGSGSVFPLVKSFDDTADGALLYSGLRETTAGTEPTLGCVRRGILFEELLDYVCESSGAEALRDGGIRAVTSDGKIFPYADEPVKYADYYWGNTQRVFYRGLYESGGDISVCTEENSEPAPAVLAMVGYYKNAFDSKLTVKKLIQSADTKYSLRLFFGMDPDDLHDGAGAGGSAQNVQELIFYPEYHEITVYGAEKNGSEGESGFFCETDDAKIYSSDDYFRAMSGERVTLRIEPKTDAELEFSLFGSESGESISLERSGSLLSFDMPDEPATLQIRRNDDSDYGWYLSEPDSESFEIGSEGELRALAAIVGGYAENVGQFGFSGREIRLTDDIELVGAWPGIGSGGHPFEGTLDGCGKSITGLRSRDAERAGLFSELSGCVRRLHVAADIDGAELAGAIAAVSSGEIELCSVSGSVGGDVAGAIAGENVGSVIGCISRADVDGSSSAGGISGRAAPDALTEKCLAVGSVSGAGSCNGITGAGGGQTTDCAAIDTIISDDIGHAELTGESVSAAEMCLDEFVLTLGSGFAANGGCLPRLYWEEETGHSSSIVREWSDAVTGDVLRELVCSSCRQHFIETVSQGSCDTGGMKLDTEKWDGFSVDVSFYFDDEDSGVYIIDTAAKLAGAAAIVNGLVNPDCRVYTGSAVLSAEQWNSSEYVFNGSGTRGQNNRSNDDYSYGCCDFSGKTLIVTSDLDMTAGNYMPLGGQYLMEKDNGETKISASFCGVFDGRGHNIKIYCDRYSADSYGNGQAVGLIGRLGVHDNDPAALRPQGAGVRDVSVSGYVHANRSVGGVVGKIGKTDGGADITGCVNYAEIVGNDSQGTGGIVGSAFNEGSIASCFNAGRVSNPDGACAGIAGQCEISVTDCYNIGTVSGSRSAAIAVYADGSDYACCFYLSGSADTGLYGYESEGVKRLDETQLRSDETLAMLGDDFDSDRHGINNGFPVLKWQNGILPDRELYYSIKGKTDINAGKAETLVPAGALTGAAKSARRIGASGVMILPDTDVKSCGSSSVVFSRQDAREISTSALTLSFDGGNGLRIQLGSGFIGSMAELTETERFLSWSDVLFGAYENADDEAEITLEALDDGTIEQYLSVLGEQGLHDVTYAYAARVVIKCKWQAPLDDASADLLIKVSDAYAQGACYKVLKADGEYGQLAGECVIVDGDRYLCISDVYSGVYIAVLERASEFGDVSENAWYFDSVIKATDAGLMSGVGNGLFAPLDKMTRAMLAQILYRIAGEPEVTYFDGFTDVDSGDWFSRCASWGYKSGVITGYPDGSFGGERAVSRQELCQILRRFAGLKKLDVSSAVHLDGFDDADSAAEWAAGALSWAVGAGLIKGNDLGRLCPTDSLSRAEAAAVAVRFAQLLQAG